MNRRLKLCSNLVEEANILDNLGEYELANELTKVANKLSNNEISLREANLFRGLSRGLGNLIKSPKQLGGLMAGGLVGGALANQFGRRKQNLPSMLNSVKDPNVRAQLQQKVQAYQQQQQALTKTYQDLMAEITNQSKAQPQQPAQNQAQPGVANQPVQQQVTQQNPPVG